MGHDHDDFEVEPIPGLPERPPEGEVILWQGAPNWHVFARRVFHVRKIAAYFAILAAWAIVAAIYDGDGIFGAAVPLAIFVGLGFSTVAFFALYAFLVSRTTVYTLTNRRLVMRIGVALPITINYPFAKVEAAALKTYPDGSGNIAVSLAPGTSRLTYPVLWPHVRPWRISRPEPMLRAIPDAEEVAGILTGAFVDKGEHRVSKRQTSGPARVGVGGDLQPAAS